MKVSDSTSAAKGYSRPNSFAPTCKAIKEDLHDPPDLVVKEFLVGARWQAAIVYLSSLSDDEVGERAIIQSLMLWTELVPSKRKAIQGKELQYISSQLLPAHETLFIDTHEEMLKHVLMGDTLLLLDGHETVLVIKTQSWPSPGIGEVKNEITIRGPRMGLSETISASLGMLRAQLKTSQLVCEPLVIGRKSQTDVYLVYVEGIAPGEIVDEVRTRLEAIDTSIVLSSGTIESLIRDHPFCLFSMIRVTERPDSVVAELDEGRVAVLVDGTPYALTMPTDFHSLFASPEDYYSNFPISVFLKLFRMFGFALSLLLTPTYVALNMYHQELIPLPLLLNIASTLRGIPFPIAVNALGAELIVEVLRESGIRLPKQYGPAVSIVGGLVLGTVAVEAGFVPPGIVIVVTLATIASFAIPRAESAILLRLLRFGFLGAAAALGLYGIGLGLVLLLYYVANLKSLGIPFLTLYTPGRVSELGEKVARPPERLTRPVRPGADRDRKRRGTPPRLKDPGDKAHD